jgi:hypothetical protein
VRPLAALPLLLLATVLVSGCGVIDDARALVGDDHTPTASCTRVVVAQAPDTPGLALAAIPRRVRQIVSGSRPADTVRPPANTDGTTATWDVVRDGSVVASVTFFHAPGARGWLVESTESCAGLSVWP